jgi:hypothetical protein
MVGDHICRLEICSQAKRPLLYRSRLRWVYIHPTLQHRVLPTASELQKILMALGYYLFAVLARRGEGVLVDPR